MAMTYVGRGTSRGALLQKHHCVCSTPVFLEEENNLEAAALPERTAEATGIQDLWCHRRGGGVVKSSLALENDNCATSKDKRIFYLLLDFLSLYS